MSEQSEPTPARDESRSNDQQIGQTLPVRVKRPRRVEMADSLRFRYELQKAAESLNGQTGAHWFWNRGHFGTLGGS